MRVHAFGLLGSENGIPMPVVAMLWKGIITFVSFLYSYLFTLNRHVFKLHPCRVEDLISESPIYICPVTNAAGSLRHDIPVGTRM